jgi:hypothetical protein
MDLLWDRNHSNSRAILSWIDRLVARHSLRWTRPSDVVTTLILFHHTMFSPDHEPEITWALLGRLWETVAEHCRNNPIVATGRWYNGIHHTQCMERMQRQSDVSSEDALQYRRWYLIVRTFPRLLLTSGGKASFILRNLQDFLRLMKESHAECHYWMDNSTGEAREVEELEQRLAWLDDEETELLERPTLSPAAFPFAPPQLAPLPTLRRKPFMRGHHRRESV